MDRRQFLAAVALGAPGRLDARDLPRLAPEEARATGEPQRLARGASDPRFAEGHVLGIDGATLLVHSPELLLQRVRVRPGARIWKLRPGAGLGQVQVGDGIYARGEPAADGTFVADRVWVNIVNLSVAVTATDGDRLRLRQPHGGELVGHAVPSVTRLASPPAGPGGVRSELRAGMHVQVVGTWRPGSDEIDLATVYR